MSECEFLETVQAAAFFGRDAAGEPLIAAATLERWRRDGTGPAFRKFGRRCAYSRADLAAWAERQRRQSTRAGDADGWAPPQDGAERLH